MLEYDFTEAHALLTKNLESAEKSLSGLDEDIQFLKDQITTTEVSILFTHLLPMLTLSLTSFFLTF
jgi:hypothetical protein